MEHALPSFGPSTQVGAIAAQCTMPAEWAQHRATWLAWPHNAADWPGKFAPITWVYGEIIRHLSRKERVCVLVNDSRTRLRAEQLLTRVGADRSQVDIFTVKTDRAWVRDTGPVFTHGPNGKRYAICWGFNAWAKYDNYEKDKLVSKHIAAINGVEPLFPHLYGKPIVLEGGALDVDGKGTLLATEECLLSDVQVRNPGLSAHDWEGVFAQTLGAHKVIWLGRGIVGDDTHGHIDDLCRFVAPGRVLLCTEHNPNDENYIALQENRERLQGARDANGRSLEVIPLPMPHPLYLDGQRLPASYANFYIANGIVLVPTFNDPNDRIALGRIAEAFPNREVIGIHAVDLVWGFGTLHCMTQQEPLAASEPIAALLQNA